MDALTGAATRYLGVVAGRIGYRIGDDFFSMGGHSLLAIRLISAVRKEVGVDMSIGEVFDHPTLGGMSELLSSRQQVQDGGQQLSVQARPAHIPLSYSQERLWFIDQLEGSVHYHIPVVLQLRGVLDIAALSYALRGIVNRHEVLRTVVYMQDGIPFQRVLEKDLWELSVISYAGEKDAAGLSDYLQALTTAPFDLSRDHMLRAHLLVTGVDEYLLVVTLHHIASDGWSNSITVRELAALYNAAVAGKEAVLTPLPLQYADYAIWQRAHFSGTLLATQLDYWRRQLDQAATLEIQTDHPRRQIANWQGDGVGFHLDKMLSQQLTALSQAQGVTLFMTLLAAFKVLLYRYTGQTDICVGTATAGRTRQETENLIGFFINSLALRSTVRGDSAFAELLQQVKQTTLDAYAHQDVPFEQVVDAVVKQRDTYRTPLFQVLFVLQNVPGSTTLQLGDIVPEEVAHGVSTTQFELSMTLSVTEDSLSGSIIYATDLFERGRIERMLLHYEQLLRSIVSDVGQPVSLLPMLGAEEAATLLAMSRNEAAYPQEVSIVALLEAQAFRTPDHIAVTDGEATISYAQLQARSNQLAHYLRGQGVGEDVLVPICLGRNIDMVVGILGILKAGGAYVPVDPAYPASRIAYILEDTQASVVVSSNAYRHLLPVEGVVCLDAAAAVIGTYPETVPMIHIPTCSLAYIIYTSGSTGRPKGVMITHENVVRLFEHEGQLYDFRSTDVWTLFHSFSFDFSVWELYGALLYGGRVVLVSGEDARDTAAFAALLHREGVTVLNQTPAAFYLLQEELASSPLPLALRYVIFGGEALDTSRLVWWLEHYPLAKLINMYGITETTVHVSYQRIGFAETQQGSLIGRSIPTLDLYVLDGVQQLCPIGVAGELCVGGAGLARGYLHQAELTASRFIAGAPLAGITERLYRSGDLGYRRSDGQIVYLGRIDEQVKIRGYRIEPGEISRVLQEHGTVSAALVTAPLDSGGERRLVGYVVCEGGAAFDQALLLAYLRERLPSHMIPSVLVELAAIPLTGNGKVDRAALPLPDEEVRQVAYEAPRTELEHQLAALWEDLLPISAPGIHDNFFERGGHSLLAIRLVSAIRKKLQRDLPVRYIFDHPTIAGLGARLIKEAGTVSLPLLPREDKTAPIPLSYSQERLWFIDQLEGSQHYHVPVVLRITGPLNRGVLSHSLQVIVNRHEVLRTVIAATPSGNYQQVLDKDGWQLDILSDPRFTDADYCQGYIRELVTAPFDLCRDHMLRASLLILSGEEHILVLTMHHIAYDGWSSGVLSRELTELYNAYIQRRPARLPSLAIQYADYTIWQRDRLSGEEGVGLLGYWKEQLAGVLPLVLQTDLVRPAVPSLRGDTVYLSLDPSLTAALQQLSQSQEVTLFMTLLTAFKVLLYRYTAQEDICVGTIVAGRTQQETEDMIGFFVNTLALRSQVDGAEGYNKLLQQVKQTVLDGYAHQDAPFEQVVDAVVQERDMSRTPLFQVLFLLQQYAAPATLELSGLQLSGEDSDLQAAKFDLTLTVEMVEGGLSCGMLYATDLFERGRIERMLLHYEQLLRSIVSDVEQPVSLLPMLGAEEAATLLAMSRNEAAYPQEVSIVALLEAQAFRTPDHIAVTDGEATISYAQLQARSNQLAHYLRGQGVGEDVLVPICLGRNIDMVVGILGILKAGGAYVPVDPAYPASRIAYILEDTQASVVVSSNAYRHLLPVEGVVCLDAAAAVIGTYPETVPMIHIPTCSLAYIIYTSGSTGRPKGVMITHENVVRLFEHEGQLYDFRSTDVWTLFHSFSFDFSVWELYGALLYGGRVVLVSGEDARDTAAFAALLHREGVTVLNQTPAAFYLLQEELASSPLPLALRYVIFGGEALDTSRLVWWLEHYPLAKLINMYGITETTVHVSYQRIGFAETQQGSLIGRSIPTLDLYVLDGVQQLCPIGVAGSCVWVAPDWHEGICIRRS
ncbi:non-ribosomal peptide synthetase [Chitinophaga sp. MD30]|nr:non-ribosomal peptide synthetase [Chitinophaga sp. MD30]